MILSVLCECERVKTLRIIININSGSSSSRVSSDSSSALYILCFRWHIIHVFTSFTIERLRRLFLYCRCCRCRCFFCVPLLFRIDLDAAIRLSHTNVAITQTLVEAKSTLFKTLIALIHIHAAVNFSIWNKIEDDGLFSLVTVYDHTGFFV